MTVLGIDIGGSAIKYAPVRGGAPAAPIQRVPTPAATPDLLQRLADLITAAQREWDVSAVGVGVPGFIRSSDGVIVRSPNLLFLNGTAFAAELERISPLPVAVDNDANCAALGTWAALPAPRPASLVHLTLGTGLGSGIVLDGRPWRGACGFAAELGHLVVAPEGRTCGCGGRGCAETEVSETGILKTWTESRPGESVTTAREVHQRLEQGDPDARDAFRRAGRCLGILLTDIVNCLNPELITIGGGVAAAGDALMAPARNELERRLYPAARQCTRILVAENPDAGVPGAALLAAEDSSS